MSKLKAFRQLIENKASQVTPEKLRFVANQQKENIANVGSAVKQKAQDLNEKYINDILGYDVQAKYEEILKPRGVLFKDMSALQEAGLFGGAALLTGGVGGAAVAGTDEEDYLRWAVENGYVLN